MQEKSGARSTPATRAVGRCLAAAALFALAVPAAKVLLGRMEPLELAGLLYLGAALYALPAAWGAGTSSATYQSANLARVGAIVVLGGIVAPVAMLFGLGLAPAASVSLWLNLETVATAVFAGAFFKEHLGPRAWSAVAIVALAGAILALPAGPGSLKAALLVAAACGCWALDNNLTAMVDGLTPSQTTLVKGLFGGAVSLGFAVAGGKTGGGAEEVLVAIALGAVSYGASLRLYIGGAQELGAARAQLVFASAPFIGCLLSWAVLRELVRPAQLAAGALMGLGFALLFARHEHEHAHRALTHTHAHSHDDGHHTHDHPAPVARHTHLHSHAPATHSHRHMPDLHHRHDHWGRDLAFLRVRRRRASQDSDL